MLEIVVQVLPFFIGGMFIYLVASLAYRTRRTNRSRTRYSQLVIDEVRDAFPTSHTEYLMYQLFLETIGAYYTYTGAITWVNERRSDLRAYVTWCYKNHHSIILATPTASVIAFESWVVNTKPNLPQPVLYVTHGLLEAIADAYSALDNKEKAIFRTEVLHSLSAVGIITKTTQRRRIRRKSFEPPPDSFIMIDTGENRSCWHRQPLEDGSGEVWERLFVNRNAPKITWNDLLGPEPDSVTVQIANFETMED